MLSKLKMMELLDIKEGKNQLEVLSIIAEDQIDVEKEAPRQKYITKRSVLSKGAVSNNCKKLVDEGVLREEDSKYYIDQKILDLYKEFVEAYFVREVPEGEFKEEIENVNEIKTESSENVDEIFEWFDAELFDLILFVLSESRTKKVKIKNLREVFLNVNQVLISTGYKLLTDCGDDAFDDSSVKDAEKRQKLIKFCLSLDVERRYVERFLNTIPYDIDMSRLIEDFSSIFE